MTLLKTSSHRFQDLWASWLVIRSAQIVAMTLVRLAPGYCDGVVVEDPPGLGGSLDPRNVADTVEESVRVACRTPPGPSWRC